MDKNFSQDVQCLPDSQDGFKSPVQLSDNSALLSPRTTSTPISYEVQINESFECVFDPECDKSAEAKENVVPVKLISSQVASQKSDVNALFSELDDYSNVSTPSPPISPECENEIDDGESTDVELSDQKIKEFNKLASKISGKLKYGNNLLRISKQQYIKVENMVDRLSSENRYLYKATDDTKEKILDYIISELNLGYSAKHVKTQIKLYVQENIEDLQTLTVKYLAVKGISLKEHLKSF